MRTIFSLTLLVFLTLPSIAVSQTIELYVDQKSKQVFTEPGAGRVKLGTFAQVQEGKQQSPEPTAPSASALSISETPSAAYAPAALSEPNPKKEWYDRLTIRGYTQFRYTSLWDHDGADFFHPADKSVAEDTTFLIRRARLILSGDVADRLFVYVQPELMASPTDGDFSTQLRDVYGDIALDKEKEFRIRVGESKVPYGFVNMQSSQNRAPLERADALNSAVEGERDIGTYLYWAPTEIRKRFRHLVTDGLKGSGDYGVLAIGTYSGQGLNRTDTNDSTHVVARASYPFLFSDGQIFEPGIQAYTGRFVPKTKPFTLEGSEEETTPNFRSDGLTDQRVAVSAVMYPQPLGFEAEWNVGRGPELSDDMLSIEEKSLQGGYLQANYKLDVMNHTFFPFVRWQYYNGGRKFGRNAPHDNVNEWDFGLEFSPWKEVELTAIYSYTNERTNTNVFPYESLTDGSRLAFQAQVNY